MHAIRWKQNKVAAQVLSQWLPPEIILMILPEPLIIDTTVKCITCPKCAYIYKDPQEAWEELYFAEYNMKMRKPADLWNHYTYLYSDLIFFLPPPFISCCCWAYVHRNCHYTWLITEKTCAIPKIKYIKCYFSHLIYRYPFNRVQMKVRIPMGLKE